MIFFNNLIQLIFGAEVKIIYVFEKPKDQPVWGAYHNPANHNDSDSVCYTCRSFLFRRYSKLGKLMQAVDNPELAKLPA